MESWVMDSALSIILTAGPKLLCRHNLYRGKIAIPVPTQEKIDKEGAHICRYIKESW